MAARKIPKNPKKLEKKSVEVELLPPESDEDREVAEELDLDREGDEIDSEEINAAADNPLSRIDPAQPLLVPEERENERSPALSSTDPLKIYMEQIRHLPLLDPENELKLALELFNTGSKDAAKRLVQANLRLVVKIAFEYRSVYANVLDLIQEGNVGLIKAVSKYDPAKGARLSYYASWWIRSYILKYLLDNFRLVKVGTTQAQKKLFFHLMREKERLEAQGLLPAPKLIADRLQVREKDVVEMQKRLGSQGTEVSFDQPTFKNSESSSTLEDTLSSADQEGADEALARDQWLRKLHESLPSFEKTLDAKEKALLRRRMLAEEPETLQEVADQFGLTRERARQIEAQVLKKFRTFLRVDA